ncbi:MAG: MBL fold metallo-hydrolase [Muribaculaceae bacterium]|nr:MBL fold metallo-hydrolase [Muribaculaceae bacterium]
MSTRFTALEIGSGDAFLLEDEGKTILFDSGGSKNRIKDLLKDKGITRIDIAICSHNDGDHANGFIGLLKSYQFIIDEIWLPYWWASILQYANEHGINWAEVEMTSHEINDKKDYNSKLLYSDEHEPISDEVFGEVLSNLAERMDNKDMSLSSDRLFYDIAYETARNMIDRLAYDTKHNIDILHDPNLADIIACDIAYHFVQYISNRAHRDEVKDFFYGHIDEFLPPNSFDHLVTAYSGSNIRIMFNNIMEIAVWAYQRGCKIKWFEPTKSFTRIPIPNSNFIALNSTLKRQVKKLKDLSAFAYALYLTVENEYSLVFEYCKGNIPIIRFSADSDCEFPGPQSSYEHEIIVTAPHHGSEANANVYDAIDPKNQDNIIWIRSDALNKTQGRPCSDFKLRKNKYCLTCKNRIRNKKIEVCFEYDILIRQWKSISGYQCIR